MDYQEKFAALQSLAEISLRMRAPGDWYVSHGVEVKNGHVLEGRYGNGPTPEAAIEDHWRQIAEISPPLYVVIDSYGKSRRAVRWTGYMWRDVAENNGP